MRLLRCVGGCAGLLAARLLEIIRRLDLDGLDAAGGFTVEPEPVKDHA